MEQNYQPEQPSIAAQTPVFIVVTGIMAAGKSTVSHLLAQQFARGVHVDADVLQRMIVSGGQWVSQSEPGDPRGEAARQLRLRLKNMCLLGRSFYEAGFSVVLNDIIIGERRQHLQEELHDLPFTLVVLAPHVDAVLQRDQARPKETQGSAWAEYLDGELRKTMAGTGLWVDSTSQTPQETVEYIMQRL